jgi:hypothetical protein
MNEIVAFLKNLPSILKHHIIDYWYIYVLLPITLCYILLGGKSIVMYA